MSEFGSKFAVLVKEELKTAREDNARLNSAHEAYAVIKEEVEEFWLEVKKKPVLRSRQNMAHELVQVAAMCQRTAEDLELVDNLIHNRTIVTLCGSTRFSEAFQQANLRETMLGNIVLSIGCDTHSDDNLFAQMTPEEQKGTKEFLDNLHFDKIRMSDEILVLNVGGYIGESTRREVAFAQRLGKRIRYLEEAAQ